MNRPGVVFIGTQWDNQATADVLLLVYPAVSPEEEPTSSEPTGDAVSEVYLHSMVVGNLSDWFQTALAEHKDKRSHTNPPRTVLKLRCFEDEPNDIPGAVLHYTYTAHTLPKDPMTLAQMVRRASHWGLNCVVKKCLKKLLKLATTQCDSVTLDHVSYLNHHVPWEPQEGKQDVKQQLMGKVLSGLFRTIHGVLSDSERLQQFIALPLPLVSAWSQSVGRRSHMQCKCPKCCADQASGPNSPTNAPNSTTNAPAGPVHRPCSPTYSPTSPACSPISPAYSPNTAAHDSVEISYKYGYHDNDLVVLLTAWYDHHLQHDPTPPTKQQRRQLTALVDWDHVSLSYHMQVAPHLKWYTRKDHEVCVAQRVAEALGSGGRIAVEGRRRYAADLWYDTVAPEPYSMRTSIPLRGHHFDALLDTGRVVLTEVSFAGLTYRVGLWLQHYAGMDAERPKWLRPLLLLEPDWSPPLLTHCTWFEKNQHPCVTLFAQAHVDDREMERWNLYTFCIRQGQHPSDELSVGLSHDTWDRDTLRGQWDGRKLHVRLSDPA